MKITLFILEDNKSEPEIYTSAKEVYDFMKEIFVVHGKRFGYDKEDIEECCKELYESYTNNETCFGSYLGERELYCYKRIVDI